MSKNFWKQIFKGNVENIVIDNMPYSHVPRFVFEDKRTNPTDKGGFVKIFKARTPRGKPLTITQIKNLREGSKDNLKMALVAGHTSSYNNTGYGAHSRTSRYGKGREFCQEMHSSDWNGRSGYTASIIVADEIFEHYSSTDYPSGRFYGEEGPTYNDRTYKMKENGEWEELAEEN